MNSGASRREVSLTGESLLAARAAAAGFSAWPSERLGPPEDVYARLSTRMVRLAYLMSGDLGLAEDAWQEAFLRTAQRAHRLEDEGLEAYLAKAVVNEIKDVWRKRRRAAVPLLRLRMERFHVEGEPGVPHDVSAMWTALQTLPTRQRCALILRYYEDLSEQQAAHVLGCSPRALNSLVSRALRAVRRFLKSKQIKLEELEP